MSLLEELGLVDFIRIQIENGASYKSISSSIKASLGTQKGTSARSVRRLCKKYDFHHSARLPDQQLNVLVSWSVGKVESSDS